MPEFSMPERNTCTLCGDELLRGDRVFAENFDQVRSGRGMCAKCAQPESELANEAVIDKPKSKRRGK